MARASSFIGVPDIAHGQKNWSMTTVDSKIAAWTYEIP